MKLDIGGYGKKQNGKHWWKKQLCKGEPEKKEIDEDLNKKTL